MRNSTYIMAFLITSCCMLLGGLAITGFEIYQYTATSSENSSASSQESAREQTREQNRPDSEKNSSDTDDTQETEE